MAYLSDIEIAQNTKMKPITEIAKIAGVDEEYLEQYGKYKAKVDYALLKKSNRKNGKLVRSRVASNKSPWLRGTEVGEVYTVPISHGEGRFLASDELIRELAANGQIATQ